MFQFSGLPSRTLYIQVRIMSHYAHWVYPFGNLGVKGYVRLTLAYRSLSRPSSALCAKASTVCPYYLFIN